jgi:hypothetical protein
MGGNCANAQTPKVAQSQSSRPWTLLVLVLLLPAGMKAWVEAAEERKGKLTNTSLLLLLLPPCRHER